MTRRNLSNAPLIEAANGRTPARTPVWFMRQAGRSLPEYRAAREGTTMLQSCLTPDLAAEITCQPVRRHKVDAAVLYSDIMVPLALAGVGAALVVVDAHTTYLPARLHWLTTAITVVAGLVGVFVVADSARWLPMLAGALFGAVASYALFWFISWIGQGFGYGDVRLAALVGGFAGALGIQQWWMALLSAAIIGAGLAIGVSLWRRRHPSPLGTAFAYGPALWAGPFVMLWLELR